MDAQYGNCRESSAPANPSSENPEGTLAYETNRATYPGQVR